MFNYAVIDELMNINEITCKNLNRNILEIKKISNDQELIQSDPISCPQNQKGNN